MKTENTARLHRYGDSVAMDTENTSTVYLSAHMARKLATGLLQYAVDITQHKFSASPLGTLELADDGTGNHLTGEVARYSLIRDAPDLARILREIVGPGQPGRASLLDQYHKGPEPGHLDACTMPENCRHCQLVKEAREILDRATGKS